MQQAFNKRIFTPKLFFTDLFFILKNIPGIVGIFRDKKIRRLVDKTLLVVTGINNCKYCTWIDGKIALKDGIAKQEVLDILNQQFETAADESELPALLYAQNFTETTRQPDRKFVDSLFDVYGEEVARKIMLAVRVVTFGNMYFNTWLAFPSRLKGKPASGSHLLFELPYFVCNAFKIVPFIIWRKLDRHVVEKAV